MGYLQDSKNRLGELDLDSSSCLMIVEQDLSGINIRKKIDDQVG